MTPVSVAKSTLVIFGATGDLAKKKLYKALQTLHVHNYLQSSVEFIGVGRTELDDDRFRALVGESIGGVKDANSVKFLKKFRYCQASVSDAGERLKHILKEDHQYLFYFALKPELFDEALRNLAVNGLTSSKLYRSIFLFEKPFGQNLRDAENLARNLRQYLDESQIYRIDHYLAKDLIQNILAIRFSNEYMDSVLHKHQVDHIQITVAEDIGIEQRGDYFDSTGIVKDMVQNHVIQTLALCLMERPGVLDSVGFASERTKVLQNLRIFDSDYSSRRLVRAQYETGFIRGRRVIGYVQEDKVNPNSKTESFFAGVFECTTPRWHGVPIFIRVGKRLPKRIGHISFVFKKPVGLSDEFQEISKFYSDPAFRVEFQPTEKVSLQINFKMPGLSFVEQPTRLSMMAQGYDDQGFKDGYSRLILDAFRGDRMLFPSSEEVLASWRIVDPVLELFEQNIVPLFYYPAGSWGPKESDELINQFNRSWELL